PAYKAGRPDKPADLATQLADAPALLHEAGFAVVQHEGWEADDVLASAARLARGHGWRCMVVTSDRDAFALVDDSTSLVHVTSGGLEASPLLTPELLYAAYGVRPDQYRDYAALRGDASDNLPGAPGIGPSTAARLLAAFGTLDEVHAALDDERRDHVVRLVGDTAARRLVEPSVQDDLRRNRRLMTMRDDLPLPAVESMRVPLDRAAMQRTLRARDIRLGPCLWALVGGPPPTPPLWEWDDTPVRRRPRGVAHRRPAHRSDATLAHRVAASPAVQLSLF
ncbi:MAG: 5'-3' exonuclease, partial [Phycicoccus sp.]